MTTAIVIALTARQLSPQNFGPIAVSLALAFFIVMLSDLGISQYAVRELAKGDLTAGALGALYARRMIVSVGLSVLVGIAATWYAGFHPWLVVALATLLTMEQACQLPLRGAARTHVVGVSTAAGRVLALGAFGLLGRVPELGPTTTLVFVLCIAPAISLGLLVLWTPRAHRPNFRHVQHPPRLAPFAAISIAIALQQLDILVLHAASGAFAAGTYGAVSRWILPVMLLANAFSQAGAPLFAKAPSLRSALVQLKSSVWILGAGASAAAAVFALAPALTHWVLGANYASSAGVLRLLAIAALLSMANQPLGAALVAKGYERAVAYATMLAVGTQLVLIAALAPRYGAMMAGIAAICTQALCFVFYAAKVMQRIKYDSQQYGPRRSSDL